MTKKSKTLPDWYPLKVYSQDLQPAEWAREIRARIEFFEIYIEEKDPDWLLPKGERYKEKHDSLKSERNNLPATWLKWFISIADPSNEDAPVGKLSYVDKDLICSQLEEPNHEQAEQAIKLMTGREGLQLGTSLSENKDLLFSTFHKLALLHYEAFMSDVVLVEERDKLLDSLSRRSPLLHSVLLDILDSSKPLPEPYQDKPYHECLVENRENISFIGGLMAPIDRVWVGIDMSLDDKTILADMKQKLKQFRTDPRGGKKIPQAVINKWNKYKLLQVLDLYIWAHINDYSYTRSFIVETLWPYSDHDEESLRNTIEPLLRDVFTWSTLKRL